MKLLQKRSRPLSPPDYAKASSGKPAYLANGALIKAQLAAKASSGKPAYLANGALIKAQLAAKASSGRPSYLADGALIKAQLAAKASVGKPSYLADGAPEERSRPLKLRLASQKICEANFTFNLLEL
jgi:hypothetical protein